MQQVLRGIFLIVLAALCVCAGTAAAFELSVVWNTTYGDEETNESAYSIIQAENESLIFAGDTDAKGAGLADAWLVLFDEEEGTLLSDAAYGTLLNDTAFDVIQAEDGSIVFAGIITLPLEADLYHTDAWVVGINATGDEVLNRTFGGPEFNATANSIVQTTDGGYLVAGSIEGYGTGTTDAWLVKVNVTGDEEWSGTFGGDGDDTAYSVIEDADGNFLFAGDTESFEAEEADAWVVKTNSTGMELWNATFGGAGNDTAREIFQETSQNFSFVGTTTFFSADNRTDTDAWYQRINATGAPLGETTLGGAEVNATAQAAVDTPDGGLLVAGSIEDYGSGNVDAWLIKLDPSGEEEWNGALGGSNQDLARSIIRISETSYVFAGEFNRTLEAQPPSPDAWAVRLDEVIEPAPTPSPGPTPGPAPVPPPKPTPVPKPVPRAKNGDFVWEDRNGNGIQDSGEPGIKGVKVILYDSEGAQIRSRTTDSEGRYCFCSLKAGTYSLRFIRPEGYVFTLEEQGDDPALDSDADIDTGNAGPIDLAENEKDRTWDAGLVNVSTIGIDVEKSTNGEDADEPPGPSIPVNATVNWTYTVTNTGLVPLFAIELVDDMIGAVSGPASGDDDDGILQSGETWVYEANGTADAGQYANNATVSGTFSTATAEDSDPSHYNGTGAFEARIELEKYIYDPASRAYVEADEPPGVVFTDTGPDIQPYYSVTNTGDVDLINVEIDDFEVFPEESYNISPIGDVGNDGILSPGETWEYEYAERGADVHCLQEERTVAWPANVTAQDPAGNEVTDTDPAYYTLPLCAGIDLEKYVNGEEADEPPGVIFENANDTVNITYTVTSTGINPLVNVLLTDPMVTIEGPLDGDGDRYLDEGETWSYRVRPGDEPTAGTGEHMNTATVTAQDEFRGYQVTDTDTAYWTGPEAGGAASIDLEKYIFDPASRDYVEADEPPGVVFESDDLAVTHTFTVTNTGDVDLSDVELEDSYVVISGPKDEDGNDVLDSVLGPGETWYYDVPIGEDPDSGTGEHMNTATVTARDPAGNEVTDTDVAYWTGPPWAAIELEKYVNGVDADEPPGVIFENANDTVIITYTVENTGTRDLSNVVLSDPMVTVEGPLNDNGDGRLNEFETWNYRVRPGDEPTAGTGEHMNTATVSAQYYWPWTQGFIEVNDTDVAYWTGPEAEGIPAIGLEVQVENETNPASPGPDVPVGTPVSLFFYVTNTGEVGLTNVALSADGFTASGTGEGDDGNDILDAGETWGYETSVDAVEGTQQIDAAVTAEDPDGGEVSDSRTVYYTGVLEDQVIDEENGEPVNGENGEPVDGENGEPVNGENGEPVDGENGEPVNGVNGEPVDGENGEPANGEDGEPVDEENGEPVNGENGEPVDG
ncbi:MAG: SdrD B-like domain-containing protein [Methanomicrobiaceae archaeon]|nr:SdrD B-like domain-containing protein [Methanomicrobiaceae archaeon]